jgi:hypothetical protein
MQAVVAIRAGQSFAFQIGSFFPPVAPPLFTIRIYHLIPLHACMQYSMVVTYCSLQTASNFLSISSGTKIAAAETD